MVELNKKIITLASFLIFLIAIVSQSKALSLGAAPGVMQIGELERGKEYSVDFYLVTNSAKELVTTLGFKEGRREMMLRNVTGRYTFIPAETSEEDISKWVKFLRSKLAVSTRKSFPIRFPNGEIVNANEKATLILDIPPDAEPGYHYFEVVMSPNLQAGGGGVGVSTIGVTRPIFIFKVPGIAKREGVIEGIAGSRSGGRAVIDVLFRNTGTVTMDARVSSLKIYNETGDYAGTLNGGYVKVPPKTTGILRVYWYDKNTDKQKTIRVEATVDYTTGSVTREAMVTIPKAGVVTKKVVEAGEFPWWIIILLIGLVLLYVYWRRK